MDALIVPVSLAVIFFVFCVLIALYQAQKHGRVRLVDWAVLAMGAIYGGAWAFVMTVTHEGAASFWGGWLLPSASLYWVHTLCAVVLVVCTYGGYLGGQLFLHKRPADRVVNSGLYDNRISLISWLLFVIGVVMQVLYSSAYGGLLDLLDYSSAIRAGYSVAVNPLSFLQPFGGLVIFSSFIFFGLLINGRHRLLVGFGFAVSFLFSMYVLTSWHGRINFLIYFAALILGVLIRMGVRPFLLIAGLGGVLIGFIFLVYQLSVLLEIKAADNLVVFIANELSFPFVSFFAQLGGGHLLRGFQDFLYAPLYFLPSSWWVGFIETVGQVNTAVVLGAKKGEQDVTSAIPVDLLTLGLMQASVIGVVVVGLLFGLLLHLCERLLLTIDNAGVRAVIGAYFALKIGIIAVFYAEPELVIAGNFDLIVSLVFVYLVRRFPSSIAGVAGGR